MTNKEEFLATLANLSDDPSLMDAVDRLLMAYHVAFDRREEGEASWSVTLSTPLSKATRKSILGAMQKLPDDAEFEDLLDVVLFYYKIERGLEDIRQGKTLTQDEVEARFRAWHPYPGRPALRRTSPLLTPTSVDTLRRPPPRL